MTYILLLAQVGSVHSLSVGDEENINVQVEMLRRQWDFVLCNPILEKEFRLHESFHLFYSCQSDFS